MTERRRPDPRHSLHAQQAWVDIGVVFRLLVAGTIIAACTWGVFQVLALIEWARTVLQG
jgi:hypothetical protein